MESHPLPVQNQNTGKLCYQATTYGTVPDWELVPEARIVHGSSGFVPTYEYGKS